jgi:hypothetical protein
VTEPIDESGAGRAIKGVMSGVWVVVLALVVAIIATTTESCSGAQDDLGPGLNPPTGTIETKRVAMLVPEFKHDLFFVAAVEDFVREACPLATPPEPYATLFAGLGSDNYRERAQATRTLTEMSYAPECLPDRYMRTPVRWLLWGRHNKDMEVRYRSNLVLHNLFSCAACHGSGYTTAVGWSEVIIYDCHECKGKGSLWDRTMWEK